MPFLRIPVRGSEAQTGLVTCPPDLSLALSPSNLNADRAGTDPNRPDQRAAADILPAKVQVAFLTNVYPKVSHSFIRREIEALERQGFDVFRTSVRHHRTGGSLPEPRDQAEALRTHVLLDGNPAALVRDVLAMLPTRTPKVLRALRLAISIGRRGSGMIRSLAYLAEACRLVRLLEARGIRHLHVHFGTNPAAVARFVRLLSDITYSFTVHGPDEFDAPAGLLLPEKVEDAAFVVAISDYGRAQLMRWSRTIDWKKINVVRCGVDESLLQATPIAPVGKPGRLVCIGRLSAQKGFSLLLGAVARLSDKAVQLRIVGDGELRAELEAQIAAHGLEGRVVLLGAGSAEDVRREISEARALVLPSFAEGLPVVLMEALALGRPVIATRIAGIPELVDERCGWLVPAGNEEELARALREALACEPARLARMGAAGRQQVLRNHDANHNAGQLSALLRSWV